MQSIACRSLAAAAALLGACAAPPNNFARALQTAQDFNLDSRFGRGDSMADRIAPELRQEYGTRHHGWGGDVRLVDVELAGSTPRGEHDIDVLVRVSWYLTRDEEVHSTTLEQGWRDQAGGWRLVSERRVEGDVGLLGEHIVYETPPVPRPAAQFPTIRLGETAQ
jgi:hypothetical protein